MSNILIIIVAIAIALLVILMWYNMSKVNKTFDSKVSPSEPIRKTNILSKAFKLISYQEALEASKKFIFDIAKAVVQKFTPDDQKGMIREGKVLFDKGVRYVHVVDVLSLSLQKQRDVNLNKFAQTKNGSMTRK